MVNIYRFCNFRRRPPFPKRIAPQKPMASGGRSLNIKLALHWRADQHIGTGPPLKTKLIR